VFHEAIVGRPGAGGYCQTAELPAMFRRFDGSVRRFAEAMIVFA
jgi:hypothetical protein